MWIRKIISGSVVLWCSTAAMAQGAFDFGDIPGTNGPPTVDVNLNQAMIGFFRGVVSASNPEAADLLAGLRGVRVRVYSALDNTRPFNSFIDEVTEELEGSGWQRAVFAEDGGSKVRIHMRMTAEEISGLTVMVIDNSEAIFLNIDGSVSAADLGKVMATLPVNDVLGSLSFPPPGAGAPRTGPEPTPDGN